MRGKYHNLKQNIGKNGKGLEQQWSVVVTKNALNVGNVKTVYETEQCSLSCQHCKCVTHRFSGYSLMTVCPSCKAKNHCLHNKCPLLQNPTVGKT